ncbi:hypothetical protein AYO44_11090 [Planctomycetaceae bacterium SCGC AG-212-F19]|nr:hypothetical protein AYO44_11090 [Planctomycetaceae bacterium SCGC AG-212-F19]
MLCTNPLDAAVGDRRVDSRIRFGAGLYRIPVLVGAVVEEAVVRDISREGIGLLLTHEVTPGQLITMQVFSRGWQRGHLKTSRVMHTDPAGDGRWAVGCSLLQPFTEEEFQAVVGASDEARSPSPAHV